MFNNNGYTLIELMIALVISSVVLGSLYQVFSTTDNAFKIQNEMVTMEQNLRVGLDSVFNELRMAGYNNNSPGTRSINAFTGVIPDANNNSGEITFVYDIDNSGIAGDIATESVTFRLDQPGDPGYRDPNHRRLVRGTTGLIPNNFQVVAENIISLIFTFYNSAGVTIIPSNQTIRDSIKRIQISITARTEKIDRTIGTFRTNTMTAQVVPRNLAY